MKRKHNRGAVKASESDFIGAWLPKPLVALLDRAIRISDTDRSKFVRAAVREKLEASK